MTTPALPAGFQLESNGPPELPPGFQLEQPRKFGLADTWPAQLAKSIYGAVTLPGDVYQGNATVPQSENMPGGQDTSAIGRVTDLAALGSPVAKTAIPAKVTAAPAPSAEELISAAKGIYKSPEIKAIQIPPQAVAGLSGKIQNDLVEQGFRPTAGNAPGTFAELNRLAPPDAVKSVGVDDLRAARRALGISAGEKNAIGQATPDARAATQAIGQIDDYLNTLAPSLKEANANYSAAKAAQTLDFRSMKAEHRAAKTGSGSNIENTMRQEVDKIPNRGLMPQEVALRDRITEGTFARNSLRKIGKLGVGDGLSLLLHGAAAIPTGGMTLPVAIAGTAARKTGEALTRRQINQLNNMIRSRSPLAQSMAPTITSSPGGLQEAFLRMLLSSLVRPQSQDNHNAE